MELQSEISEDIRILKLSGSFDSYSSEPARSWLADEVSRGNKHIVVDLSGVSFMDSTALSTLVQGMKWLREANGDLRLCGMQQPVRMLFELTRLDRVFEIFITQSEAVEAFLVES